MCTVLLRVNRSLLLWNISFLKHVAQTELPHYLMRRVFPKKIVSICLKNYNFPFPLPPIWLHELFLGLMEWWKYRATFIKAIKWLGQELKSSSTEYHWQIRSEGMLRQDCTCVTYLTVVIKIIEIQPFPFLNIR